MTSILKINHTIILFFTLILSPLKAQQPSHFILGEEELSNVNIYDLLQDSEGNYWVATNEGLYKYNGYDITKVPDNNMISSSVFNLQMDYNHDIYCHNLSGQIFKIENDSCKVHFSIPDSLLSHDISYGFDNKNHLTILSTKFFQVESNKKIKILYPESTSSSDHICITKDTTIILYLSYQKKLLRYKNETLNSQPLDLGRYIPNYIYYNNNLICYDQQTTQVIPQLTENNAVLPHFGHQNVLSRYYSDGTNFWIANLSGGIFLFDKDLIPTTKSKPLFESTIISAFLKDSEGNTLLGTFGEGIIVIPNINIEDIKLISENTKVTNITSSYTGNIFFGTQKGQIYKIDSLDNMDLIKEKGIQQIEILKYLPRLNCLLFNEQAGTLLNLETKASKRLLDGSVKDICLVNTNEYLIATNSGVFAFNSKLKDSINLIHELRGRVYSVGYNPLTKTIYCGSAVGLKIGARNNIKLFKQDGKTVMCNSIIYFDGKIMITTKKNGVLIFTDDKLSDAWNISNGLISNNTKLIKSYKNRIYVSTDKGLNIISKTGKIINLINKSNGLNSNNIVDFEVVNSTLWVVTNKGIQKLNLNKLTTSNYSPKIEISCLTVNDIQLDTTVNNFEYSQNKFVFEISSKSLKYQNDIYYNYQLVGIDKNWIKSPYQDHKISYKSLPPGKYEFKVKAIYKSNSSNVLSYKFKIDNPYWRKWWFYLIIAVIFLSITLITFQVQINRQKHKSILQSQLDSSQLTALKSQMNPHFIFNSLNSIQDLILQQDKENAYNYISKFALLVRKILDHSDKDFVEIEEEVKILNVYLELEKLRFKKDFVFELESNNITDLEIPPMLIQPFVENALKHGLLHKKGNKSLNITFRFKKNILTCTIIDNGVGRKKSNEIKERQNKSHKSFSVQSIHTRFSILENIYGDEIGVKFEDLYYKEQPTGTKVILTIPFNRKF